MKKRTIKIDESQLIKIMNEGGMPSIGTDSDIIDHGDVVYSEPYGFNPTKTDDVSHKLCRRWPFRGPGTAGPYIDMRTSFFDR